MAAPTQPNKLQEWQLVQRQGLTLSEKVELSTRRIRQWYRHWDGQVAVSFSGGKDSTVLLHLVRAVYPDVPAVFADTGLEFPEIRAFVKTIPNVVWVKPAMNFKQVLEVHGYPVVSKEVSQKVRELRTTQSVVLRHIRLYGDAKGNGRLPPKWHHLEHAPFHISERCCTEMKKKPMQQYTKCTGRYLFVGTMMGDSRLRWVSYMRYGCNAFSAKAPKSTPLAFWTEGNVWAYLKERQVPYCSIYDMGYERTGCIFCMFGCHLEKKPNRFQRLQQTHPKLWRYCMEVLGLQQVLDYLGVPSKHKGFFIFDGKGQSTRTKQT